MTETPPVSPLEQELTNRLKDAMRARDARASACIRMVKTRIMERRTSKGFTGVIDDNLVREVISAYAKTVKKGIEEFEAVGVTTGDALDQLRFEVVYLADFLPKFMDEPATRALVSSIVTRDAITDPKQAGRVMGTIMKAHKGEVDPDLVKRIIAEVLGA
jgi:uncharacterized protein YqeY